MTTEKQNRTHQVGVYLTPREFDHFNQRRRLSTCSTRSEYVRKLLLGKPVTVRHRNQSLDDLMAALIPLRGDLNSVSKSYNQVAGKLHLLRNLGQIELWLLEHKAAWETVQRTITEIKSIISHIDDIWLQS
jgi:hypothetical protein